MSLRRVFSFVLVLAVVLCASSLLLAQSQSGVAKYEVFGGYSWYYPGGSMPATSTLHTADVPNFNAGWGAQLTYNMNRWAGIAVDGAGHYNNDFGNAHTFAVGPQFRYRTEHIVFFGEALLGAQYLAPKQYPNQAAFAFLGGGGIEYPITPRIWLRPVQFDYVSTYYSKVTAPNSNSNPFNGVRLQTGLIFNLVLPAMEGTVSAACSVDPANVDMGVPVKVSITPNGFLPKRTLSYTFASNGGKISGTGMTATVDTTGLAPGSYKVSAKVVDDGKGKHQQIASCVAGFNVNQPPMHPPILSVSANPASVKAGDSSTITAVGSSVDNRPLSYTCTPSAGRLTGNGPTYTLETAGVPDSVVGVNCTVSDDRNLTASASTSVKVNVPVVPKATKFGSIEFVRDTKRPTRVDNEAKGELDRYADALAAAPDSKGVVVGYATAKEDVVKKGSKQAPDFAAKRAVNTKEYVTKEKGIDPARIEPRSGQGGQTTDLWIVPAGATFPEAGTTVVDEAKVKAVPRVALKTKKAAHKKAAHKKAANE